MLSTCGPLLLQAVDGKSHVCKLLLRQSQPVLQSCKGPIRGCCMTSAEILAAGTDGSFEAGIAFTGNHRNASCATITFLIKWISLTIAARASYIARQCTSYRNAANRSSTLTVVKVSVHSLFNACHMPSQQPPVPPYADHQRSCHTRASTRAYATTPALSNTTLLLHSQCHGYDLKLPYPTGMKHGFMRQGSCDGCCIFTLRHAKRPTRCR